MTDDRPVGERVARLEVSSEDLARRLLGIEQKQADLLAEMQAVRASLEARSAAMRIAGWFAEVAKLILAAAVGGALARFNVAGTVHSP